MRVGDPACDVMVAWKLPSPAARDAFRDALPTDDATWERARGWVLSQAVAILAYYTPQNSPVLSTGKRNTGSTRCSWSNDPVAEEALLADIL
jgi:aminoglycoside phosphotransferase (APT) family kinase protein